MAIDLPEIPPFSSPPVSCTSHFPSSQVRHYYVAVDRLQFKMETLVDFLGVAGRRPSLPLVLCCSSRDELDALCSVVSNLDFISLSPLYSDQAELERSAILEEFHHLTLDWNCFVNSQDGLGTATRKSFMIIVTDTCLPLASLGEVSLSARVLINYDLATKKEIYSRRMSTCLAPDGIVINMVVGGEVVALKNLEESTGFVIEEMPINISEIL